VPAGALVLAALVMGAGFLLSFAGPAAGAPAEASVALFDDDGGQALFGNLHLAPGHSYVRCLRVGTTGTQESDTVQFGVADVAGGLADSLSLRIEIGDGATFGHCDDFAGSVIFDGSLTELSVANGGYGVLTGWHPAALPGRSFRITAALQQGEDRQGASAQGRFVWRLLHPDTSTTTTETGSSTLVPPAAGPQTPVPAGSSPVPSGVSQAPSDADPGGSGPEAPRIGAAGGNGPVPGPGPTSSASPLPPDITLGSVVGRLGEITLRAVRTASGVASTPQYPLAALVLAMAFLAVQHRIDGRDPKLALAATRQRENEVEFPDRFRRWA
jgi:hypothetical protein